VFEQFFVRFNTIEAAQLGATSLPDLLDGSACKAG